MAILVKGWHNVFAEPHVSWTLHHLDGATRDHMVSEVDDDVRTDTLYHSRDFCGYGRANYPTVIRTSCERGDVDSLAAALLPAFFNPTRTDKNGRVTRLNLTDSALKFAVGEFNRFYLRGLCLRAGADGMTELTVYRAKISENPRSQSEAMIGARVSITALLADLRANKGLDTHLELPPGPHSGLSARFP